MLLKDYEHHIYFEQMELISLMLVNLHENAIITPGELKWLGDLIRKRLIEISKNNNASASPLANTSACASGTSALATVLKNKTKAGLLHTMQEPWYDMVLQSKVKLQQELMQVIQHKPNAIRTRKTIIIICILVSALIAPPDIIQIVLTFFFFFSFEAAVCFWSILKHFKFVSLN